MRFHWNLASRRWSPGPNAVKTKIKIAVVLLGFAGLVVAIDLPDRLEDAPKLIAGTRWLNPWHERVLPKATPEGHLVDPSVRGRLDELRCTASEDDIHWKKLRERPGVFVEWRLRLAPNDCTDEVEIRYYENLARGDRKRPLWITHPMLGGYSLVEVLFNEHAVSNGMDAMTVIKPSMSRLEMSPEILR